jgi:hypothetical protein
MIKAKKVKIPHCGCMDGDEIFLVEILENIHTPPVIKQMCKFHIEKEIEENFNTVKYL